MFYFRNLYNYICYKNYYNFRNYKYYLKNFHNYIFLYIESIFKLLKRVYIFSKISSY